MAGARMVLEGLSKRRVSGGEEEVDRRLEMMFFHDVEQVSKGCRFWVGNGVRVTLRVTV